MKSAALVVAMVLAPTIACGQEFSHRTVTEVNGYFSDLSPTFGFESGLGTQHIEWGEPLGNSSKPYLDFEGYDKFPDENQPFFYPGQTIGAGEAFLAGYLSFRNGTVSETSSATRLEVDLNLTAIGSYSAIDALVVQDTVKFAILQTPNDGTAAGSADYVYLPDFPQAGSMRVYEDKTGRAPLYFKFGSLIPTAFGPIDDPTTGFISPSITDNPFEPYRATVAKQDFDGGALRLVNGFDPDTQNISGGNGSFFGVGNLGAWPQGTPPGVPFTLADDTVVDVSRNGASSPFAGDTEGVFGQNRSKTDSFFAIADSRGFDSQNPSASWTFDISGYKDLMLHIDMGAIAGGNNPGFPPDSSIGFEFSIDGGISLPALFIGPAQAPVGGFSYRAMDSGVIPITAASGPLQALGFFPVVKTLADTGETSTDTFLNKSPATGPGAGGLDTFSVSLLGQVGNRLTLRATGRLQFEGFAFDNIRITGVAVPEPSSLLIGAAWILFGSFSRRLVRRGGPRLIIGEDGVAVGR